MNIVSNQNFLPSKLLRALVHTLWSIILQLTAPNAEVIQSN
jgi:hypothetical protein